MNLPVSWRLSRHRAKMVDVSDFNRLTLAMIFQPLRTLLALALLVGGLWFAFTVKLGRFTLAEHFDRIGQTPEARELAASGRATLLPILDNLKQRLVGEYVEAPTAKPNPPKSGSAGHSDIRKAHGSSTRESGKNRQN